VAWHGTPIGGLRDCLTSPAAGGFCWLADFHACVLSCLAGHQAAAETAEAASASPFLSYAVTA